MSRPVVRFRPRGGGPFLAGHPWAYLDEIALDRRTKNLAPGLLVTVEGPDRAPVALAAFHPGSQVALRWLDQNPDASVDAGWFAARIGAARDLRHALGLGQYHRLVHAEGDALPGVVIDRMGDVCVVQPNAAWAAAHLEALLEGLDRAVAPRAVVVNGDSRLRSLEGLPPGRQVARGDVEGPVRVEQNGAIYLADVLTGQKTGLYFDQRDNHRFVAGLCAGGALLDVFSHSGGFALAALAAGASRALAVDSSAAALDLATRAAALGDGGSRLETRKGDALDIMRQLGEAGETFPNVVCDPPAFAPRKSALDAGLRAYERVARLAAPLVSAGGFLTLCSCSQAVDADSLRRASWIGLRAAGRTGRLLRVGRAGADHPVHPALPESGYLKALTFQLD